ncbi:serum amyloid P-component-like isoform X1 [Mauremys reevesii]|uniref:serum amyloid P-component-like isoform X1 n=2 Tax=Mauremys reevesii TaxID=260615 RepID=UPI00193F9633|nr:serum amyloid P-component-like isoform X1 [Mauremys reevesii]
MDCCAARVDAKAQVKKMQKLQLWLLLLASLSGAVAQTDKPAARIQPRPPYPSPGRELQLQCDVPGDPGPLEFLWTKEGSDVPLQINPDRILTLPPVGKNETGTYICTATSAGGSSVAKYSLEMIDLVRKVFVFPRASNDSYVILKPKPEQPLQNFTVCLRSYTDLPRPYALFSYATKAYDNEILLFKPKPGEYRLYVGGEFVTFRVPENRMEWEHVCAGWESATGIAEFWVNGKPLPRKGLRKGYSVSAEAVIILGQEQDSFGGGFELPESFVGEITDVYMWDRVLYNMESLMWGGYFSRYIFGWNNLHYELVGDVFLKRKLLF